MFYYIVAWRHSGATPSLNHKKKNATQKQRRKMVGIQQLGFYLFVAGSNLLGRISKIGRLPKKFKALGWIFWHPFQFCLWTCKIMCTVPYRAVPIGENGANPYHTKPTQTIPLSGNGTLEGLTFSSPWSSKSNALQRSLHLSPQCYKNDLFPTLKLRKYFVLVILNVLTLVLSAFSFMSIRTQHADPKDHRGL